VVEEAASCGGEAVAGYTDRKRPRWGRRVMDPGHRICGRDAGGAEQRASWCRVSRATLARGEEWGARYRLALSDSAEGVRGAEPW
jgi:hypothetical protein